ncbi:MAG: hypothetical protein MI867_04235 [Pseudomonadales bacterium]|nr:hypothetical protein [Pseudomonadales bacterium]
MKKFSAFLVIAIFVVAGLWFLKMNSSPNQGPIANNMEDVQKDPEVIPQADSVASSEEGEISNDKLVLYSAIKNQIKGRYADRLENPYWRVKLLNDLIVLFQKQYPNNWLAELEAFINQVFPEFAEDMISKLHALIEYMQWVENLKLTMQFSSMEERQAALWDKRVALFGEDAYEIWEAALKNEQLQEKLNEVNGLVGSFNDRAELYRDSLKEVFGEDIIGEEAPHKTQMMTKFLELENVQSELSSLPEQERYQQLREFRESMGMDEAALERWDQLDQERIQLWSNADRYMSEREALKSQYQGEEFNEQLWKLQVEIFGETEASYIKKEELSGYYRFENEQKYGLN